MIRKARRDDIDEIARLGDGVSPVVVEFLGNTYVTEEDGEIVAVAVAQPENSVHYLGSMVVRKDKRGKGIGKRLVAHIRAVVNTPLVVITTNDAEGFYQKLGFKQFGVVLESA